MKHRVQYKAKAMHAAPSFFQNARTREIDMSISRTQRLCSSKGYLDGLLDRSYYDVRLASAPVFARILGSASTFRCAKHAVCCAGGTMHT